MKFGAMVVPRASDWQLFRELEEMGYDCNATAGAAMDLLRHAWEVLPAIYDLQLSEISVGLRSATDDNGQPQRREIGATGQASFCFRLGSKLLLVSRGQTSGICEHDE